MELARHERRTSIQHANTFIRQRPQVKLTASIGLSGNSLDSVTDHIER
jgi:hypothetical protein